MVGGCPALCVTRWVQALNSAIGSCCLPTPLVKCRPTTILPVTLTRLFPRSVGKLEQVGGSWLLQNMDLMSQLPALVMIQPLLKVGLSTSVRLLSHWRLLTSFRGTFSSTDPRLLCLQIQSVHPVPAPLTSAALKCCPVFPGPGSMIHHPRTLAPHREPHSPSRIVNATSAVHWRLA